MDFNNINPGDTISIEGVSPSMIITDVITEKGHRRYEFRMFIIKRRFIKKGKRNSL